MSVFKVVISVEIEADTAQEAYCKAREMAGNSTAEIFFEIELK